MPLLNQGLFREAMSMARERISLYPGDADARMMYGLVLGRVGRDREAQAVFETVMEDLAAWAPAFEFMGDIARELKDAGRARSAYQTLLTLSADAATKGRLIKKLEALGAEDDFDQTQRMKGLSSEFQTMTMAELYIRQGHLDRAGQILRQIVQDHPEDRKARERLQEIDDLLSTGQPDAALRLPEAVIEELSRWLTRLKKKEAPHDP
jgi:tetratricopeptide (TPR) repeat protein